MNETTRQPPNEEIPSSDEPQRFRSEEHARIAKLVAEEALIREKLKQAALENEAAEREAKAWHARYTFVPSPRVALQAIGAGVVLVIAFFAFYPPLVDLIRHDAEIEKRKTEMQRIENQELSMLLEKKDAELIKKETELTNLRKELAAVNESVEKQLAESAAKREADLTELEEMLRAAQQRGEETVKLRNQLSAAKEALSETQQELKEASKRTEKLLRPYERFAFDPQKKDLRLPNKPNLNPKQQITLEAWFKANSFSNTQWIVFKPPDVINRQPYYQYALGFRKDKEGIYFPLGIEKKREWIDEAFKNELTENVWHHVAATYDGNRMRLYLDGKRWPNSPQISGLISSYNTDLVIGGMVKQGKLSQVFQGELAEVRIWDVERTAEQIRAGMDTTIHSNEKGLRWSSTTGLDSKSIP